MLSGGAERRLVRCGDFFLLSLDAVSAALHAELAEVAAGQPPQAQPQLQPQPAPPPTASLSFWESGGGPAFSLSKT